MFSIKKFFSEIKPAFREKVFCIWRLLPAKEKLLVFGLCAVIIITSLSWFFLYYFKNTEIGPDFGDKYTEAILGEPRYINPVLAQTNDADRDLSVIIFSGLTKYNKSGGIDPDLAEKYEISADGKTYIFYLRKNIKWHDGEDLTADDVIFTIAAIQNIEYHSPIRVNWQGVVVEKIDNYTVKFSLNNVYAPFLENTAIGIIPKHIWQDILPQNFPLAKFNLQPIGSGPYKFKKLQKDKLGKIVSMEFSAFDDYYSGRPYISALEFGFYDSPEVMVQIYNNKLAQGINFLSAEDKNKIKNHTNIYSLKLPRYFAVFFNQNQSIALADKDVRLALNYAIDKRKIVDEILDGNADIVNSPILPDLLGFSSDIKIYDFLPEEAARILEESGWQDLDGDGFREKKIKNDKKEEEILPLEIALATTNWPELLNVAEFLKKSWEQVGVKIAVDAKSIGEIQQEYIKPRKYQALLFGQILSYLPDPFSFWHSSQKKDPGLNLSLYDNRNADKLLEEARQTVSVEERVKKFDEFQNLLINDVPAVFLYSPYYLYAVSNKIKGIEIDKAVTPSQRFSDVNKWYIETKRVKKIIE